MKPECSHAGDGTHCHVVAAEHQEPLLWIARQRRLLGGRKHEESYEESENGRQDLNNRARKRWASKVHALAIPLGQQRQRHSHKVFARSHEITDLLLWSR